MADAKPTFEERTARKALFTVLKVAGLFGAAWLGTNVVADVTADSGNQELAVQSFQAAALGAGGVILAAPKKMLDKARLFVAGTLGSFIITSAVDSANSNPEPYRRAVAVGGDVVDTVRGAFDGPGN